MRCASIFGFAGALLLVNVLFGSVSTASASPSTLVKRELSNEDAICNDGSRAVFYFGANPSNKWMIFFESGGLCSTVEECEIRYKESRVLMTSTTMPDQVEGKDMLSASADDNPEFHDYVRVLVPYCSSDLWLGSKNASNNGSRFNFRGRTIFESLINDLMQDYNLTKSSLTVLAGSSAGAVGVLNHASWVRSEIQARNLSTELVAIADSGWFIDFRDGIQRRAKADFASLAGIDITALPACADLSYGYSCCLSASCLLSRKYFPPEVKSFVVASVYDIYMLEDVLRGLQAEGKSLRDNTADFTSVVSMYGGAMSESITSTEGLATNMSYFTPACFQHTYFGTSSLWDLDGGLFEPVIVVNRGSARFT